MSIIFKPEKDIHLLAPFGPTMGYYRMPEELVDSLNSKMSNRLEDYSENLVGKVSEELAFNDDTIKIAQEGLGRFIGMYQAYTDDRNTMGSKKMDNEKYDYGLQVVSGWFVRQFENEYNPLHIHTGSRLSCVGYLKLPDGIEEEWEEDYKDHHPANGHIQFASGTPSGYTCTNFVVKPQVGDFYVFPSQLFHCVYPFYTKGERRSFSMNMNFIEIPKEKSVDI
jgi:hypothetical protein